MTAALVCFGAATVLRAYTSYCFTAAVISRRSLIPFFSRSVDVAHVHEGYLVVGEQIVLELIPTEGRKFVIPVEESLRRDLARLYPAIGSDLEFRTAVLDGRHRRLIYGFLAVVIVGLAIATMILTHRGLLAW
jgi:hypothetical protein